MRIDKFLAEKFGSRTKAAVAVDKGLVLVNGKNISASYDVGEKDQLTFLEAEENFVSAGGYKLSKALKDFGYSVVGKVFADIGASTGGFTDCLFQNGASKVYCIDVGTSQLDDTLKTENIVIIDGFNARNLNLNLFSEVLDGIVIDVSFISLTYLLEAVSNVLSKGRDVIALIKPQFECGSRKVGKNGIVKDVKAREEIVEKIYDFAISVGLAPLKITYAPIIKGKNTEYLLLMKKGGIPAKFIDLKKSIT